MAVLYPHGIAIPTAVLVAGPKGERQGGSAGAKDKDVGKGTSRWLRTIRSEGGPGENFLPAVDVPGLAMTNIANWQDPP